MRLQFAVTAIIVRPGVRIALGARFLVLFIFSSPTPSLLTLSLNSLYIYAILLTVIKVNLKEATPITFPRSILYPPVGDTKLSQGRSGYRHLIVIILITSA